MRLMLAAALSLLAMPALAQTPVPGGPIIEGAIADYARPEFRAFAGAADTLNESVAALCRTPSAEAVQTAQDQFGAAVLQFARVEFVRLGPLGVDDRLERLLFWPDPKGIALKQVQAALAQKDPTAAQPETLEKKSVAMQGLVALEYLLFGTGYETLGSAEGAYRCAFAASITTLIDGVAATIDAEWHDESPDGPAQHMRAPQPTFDDYRTETEVLDKLAATLIHGTETIRDQRLTPILGATGGKPKPRSALFWRSNLTAPMLRANFQGLKDFFIAAKFPEAALSTGSGWVANGAVFEFDNAIRAAGSIDDPIEQAVADEAEFRALRYMAIITGSLDTILGDNLSAALGLTVGFSQLDGD